MDENIEGLISRIKKLEQELRDKLADRQEAFLYRLDRGKVRFEEEVRQRHQKLIKRLHSYLAEASLLNILTIPLIWGCLPPALLMDFSVTLYQFICFPVYGIPRVRRRRYIVIDRQALGYLNVIEKINCLYCGYFNGLISYIGEITARTEQYWCPIKHARRLSSIHSRYKYFFDYGDGEEYRRKLEEVRRAFDDLAAEQNQREEGR
ncbi:hypothetical protein MNBD_DELTA03-389 [hydrothermal vent metagenome]|uniref:Uncharacterized protein n=1 Tax=hydrothermal vent metagenome TaxID=652676 RepID=A0A3B0VE52_9ZZZZ